MSTALTEPQRRKLNDLESIIEKGLTTFVEVGAALAIIREQKLYTGAYSTFEAYCRAKWDWTERRARQLIASSEVVTSMGDTGKILPPTKESHAVAMADVPAEKRAGVWTKAVKESGGKPKAKDVRRAAAPHKPPAKQKSREQEMREQRERDVAERERAAKAARKAEEATKTEGGDATEPVRASAHRRNAVSGDVTVGESGEPGLGVPGRSGTRESSGSPTSDKDERLPYLLTAESALAHAASFRGLGQSAVQDALDRVREVVELLRNEEAA
jgi:hypothetical protein